MKDLTKKQFDILEFINMFILNHSESPTYQDIADEFKFTHTAARHHVDSLERKGWVTVERRKHRGILPL
jgi:repressor LexA